MRLKFKIILFITLLTNLSTCSIKKQTTKEPTKISSCLCSESSSLCYSSASCMSSVLFYVDFNTLSPVDKFSKAWIFEDQVNNSFGRMNKGKSLLLNPSSSVDINAFNSFKGEGISVLLWIKMSGSFPYTFSSILSIKSNSSPFPKDTDQSILYI